MRHLGLVGLLLLWSGCTVTVVGAPCDADDNCPRDQHCGEDGACVAGARTPESACLIVGELLARRAQDCFGGQPSTWMKLVDLPALCTAAAASATAGRLDFAPEDFGACQRGVPGLACSLLDAQDVLRGCGAFHGQVQPEGACAHMSDCAGGWCDTAGACPGVCRAYVAAEGDCSVAGSRCAPGTACTDTGSGRVCKPYRKENEACGTVGACEPPNLFCQAGVCRPKQTSGSCNPFSSTCATRHVCVDLGGGYACVPAKVSGETCVAGRLECELGQFCGAEGKCREWPGPGEDCLLSATELAPCLNGKCELVLGSGMRCQVPTPLGGTCGNENECVTSATCRGTCVQEYCAAP